VGDWPAAGGSGGGWLVVVDFLVFIRILICLMEDVDCDFFSPESLFTHVVKNRLAQNSEICTNGNFFMSIL
jgi:hypothetical protein